MKYPIFTEHHGTRFNHGHVKCKKTHPDGRYERYLMVDVELAVDVGRERDDKAFIEELQELVQKYAI